MGLLAFFHKEAGGAPLRQFSHDKRNLHNNRSSPGKIPGRKPVWIILAGFPFKRTATKDKKGGGNPGHFFKAFVIVVQSDLGSST